MKATDKKQSPLTTLSSWLFTGEPDEAMPFRMWYWLMGGMLIIHLFALPVTLMEPDSTIYAIIPKTMVETGNYLELILRGEDWLDKPHFQFWVTALSYSILGISTVAYKLPALCFLLLGVFYTYRLARELYDIQIARLASLFLFTAFHIIVSSLDVRAEPYLTGLIIASVYHFYKVRVAIRPWMSHLFAGALFAAGAVMTKGIYTLAPIGFAVIGDIIIKGDWRELFRPKWVLAILLTGIFTGPELYALYYQFDLHPEKTVFGETGVSGIRFFLWDSQWGRFANSGPIRGDGNFFTFFHVSLWAFLPWSLALLAAIFQKIRTNLPRPQRQQEFYTISGAALTFLMFSLSEFQLPHYLNIIFPFFAILTASFIHRIQKDRALTIFAGVQYSLGGLMVLAMLLLFLLFQPEVGTWTWAVFVITILPGFMLLKAPGSGNKKALIIWRSCGMAYVTYFFLALVFYPSLMHYQAGSEIAREVNSRFPAQTSVAAYNCVPRSFEFYLHNELIIYEYIRSIKAAVQTEVQLIYTDEEGLQKLWRVKALDVLVIKAYDQYQTTRLSLPFLNARTRKEVLQKNFLVLVMAR